MKSKCNKLVKQSKKKYLKDASFKGTATTGSLIIKCFQTNENIPIKVHLGQRLTWKSWYKNKRSNDEKNPRWIF